ncbi:MAG: hypothetical protein M1827_005198 [Pycnora praestabilis]|nr:MAG: hypothetical protein M1827_005198 [Pycnora praestabilis]
MSESKLDQIVKGAPRPNATVPTVAAGVSTHTPPQKLDDPSTTATSAPPLTPSDPLSTLPSSPPQIYLNLLILEASLRSQYLTLRARRRQYTFFLLLLSIWNAAFFYALFMRPREDGSGVGGSVYWVVEMGEKVGLMGGVVTGVLIWGTGQWERGIRWPRRWVGVANRGLRGMNAKLVIIKGPWWKDMLSHLSFLFPYSSFFPSPGSSYHFVEHISEKHRYDAPGTEDERIVTEEDIAPGGDYVKLLLLPKPFSPDFRENWELYRTEYWEKENERRSHLRSRLRLKQIELAKEQGGWLWWTGWLGWRRAKGMGGRGGDIERTHHHRHHPEKDAKHRHPPSSARSGSQSRTPSRSSTPTPDREERPIYERVRRGSSNSITGERRKKLKASAPTNTARASKASSTTGSRPSTPLTSDVQPTLTRGNSSFSTSGGYESDRSITSVDEVGEPMARDEELQPRRGAKSNSDKTKAS